MFEGPPPGGPSSFASLGGATVRRALDRGAGQEARADELALTLVHRPRRGRDAQRRGLLCVVRPGGAHGQHDRQRRARVEGGGPASSGGVSPTSRRGEPQAYARALLAVGSGKSYFLLMSAANAVHKPDFAAKRKHFIFSDEH